MGSLPIPTLYRNDWNTITRKWWFFGRVGSRKNIHDGLLQTGINVRVHHKIPNIPQHEFHTLSITDDWWKYNALPHTGHAGKRIERRCDFWSRAYHHRIQSKSLVQGTRRKIFVRGRDTFHSGYKTRGQTPAIVGFHMTSLKFKLQNYRSYWDFTFMVY